MIHLYCGDGKGKTTCAFGLAVRWAGHGKRAVIAQFLKSGDSGERVSMAHVPGVTLLPVPHSIKFVFAMSEEERSRTREESLRLLKQAQAQVEGGCGLAVLDECCGAVSTGMLRLEDVLDFLDRCPPGTEVVLTGREPHPALLERADYITEMRGQRHPFDQGQPAREGVEW